MAALAQSRSPAPRPQAPAADDTMALRRAFGAFTTGVTIVTALAADGRPIGLTVNSFASVSLEPPLLMWCLAGRSANAEVFRAASSYAVNILGADQEALCRRFCSRDVADRFAGVDWVAGETGVPLLQGCVARFECVADQALQVGDHHVFIGRVTAFASSSGEPLVFSHGKMGLFHQRELARAGAAA